MSSSDEDVYPVAVPHGRVPHILWLSKPTFEPTLHQDFQLWLC